MTSTTEYYGFGLAERPILSGRRMANNGAHAARWMPQAEKAFAEPFKGVTTDGTVVPGLFPIRSTGVSTKPVVDAARAYLGTLTAEQRAQGTFPVDAIEWQKWFNISPYVFRHGLILEDLSEAQTDAALALIRESTSPAGFESIRNCMRLNHTIGEITGKAEEYGEWVYFLSIFGEPSETEPWGWQLDGHHVNLHCFVLGDQVVFTPAFLGSEPVVATTGKYAGVSVMQEEQDRGLRFMQSLDGALQTKATLGLDFHGALAGAFRDNFELRYEGVRASDLSGSQQALLMDVVGVYTGRLREGHNTIRQQEVRDHLQDTYFAWMGECQDDSVFYYRVHSPVILIEFDHQGGVAFDNKTPSRNHIHAIVRTPNGNDYGKDLLRQHYEEAHGA
ncbi:MAG TPA: DUF3500 domain-containing protein [Dehalococcoidia bacterium]|jgi:hypothetical protein|nr:DUF3500 domain-containing protein [Dehalococcoidia bacterium]